MNANEIRLLIVTVAVVFIFALFTYRERLRRVRIKTRAGSVDFENDPLERKNANDPPRKVRKIASGDDRKLVAPPDPPEPFHLTAWLSRYWLRICVPIVLILALMITPLWWWHRHPEAWKLVLSDHISEAWALWKQDPHKPVHIAQSGHTLQGLTQLLDDYADILGRDPHRVIDVWVVDHHWQYWNTDTFNDYTRANRRFVDSGGKIHRMFILAEDDLRNPQVTAVLRNQCEKIGADVWRSDAAAIANKAEYQITANAFKQMPYTETGVQSFDVLQLEDLTYHSCDFSPDYRLALQRGSMGKRLT